MLIRHYVFLRYAARKHVIAACMRLLTNHHACSRCGHRLRFTVNQSLLGKQGFKPTPTLTMRCARSITSTVLSDVLYNPTDISDSEPFSRVSSKLTTDSHTETACNVPRLLHHPWKILGVDKLLNGLYRLPFQLSALFEDSVSRSDNFHDLIIA